jgi:hypothetical protein
MKLMYDNIITITHSNLCIDFLILFLSFSCFLSIGFFFHSFLHIKSFSTFLKGTFKLAFGVFFGWKRDFNQQKCFLMFIFHLSMTLKRRLLSMTSTFFFFHSKLKLVTIYVCWRHRHKHNKKSSEFCWDCSWKTFYELLPVKAWNTYKKLFACYKKMWKFLWTIQHPIQIEINKNCSN